MNKLSDVNVYTFLVMYRNHIPIKIVFYHLIIDIKKLDIAETKLKELAK